MLRNQADRPELWIEHTSRTCAYFCTLKSVAVIWDQEKSASNIAKHGIRLAEAVPVLEDPLGVVVVDDESDPMEQRFVTMGVDGEGRILVVVYTWRGEDIRLISARRAEPHEREVYENQ